MAEDTLDLKGKSWRHVVVVSSCTLVVTIVASTVMTYILWFNQVEGFADTPASTPALWGVLSGVFLGLLFIGILFTESTAPTGPRNAMDGPVSSSEAAAAVPRARPGRHRRVPVAVSSDELDQVLWAQLDQEARQRLRSRLRRRRPRQLALRIVMAPVAAVGFVIAAVAATQQWMSILPDALVLALAPVVGVVGAGYFTFVRIRATVRMWRGEVYVVTGRVEGTESGETTGEEAAATMAANYVTAELSHEQIQILRADGSLADPETDLSRGELGDRFSREALGSGVDRPPHLLVRCSRSVGSRLADGDATTLMCLGDGRAVALVRDLALTRRHRRHHRKARDRARLAARRPPEPQPSSRQPGSPAPGRHRARGVTTAYSDNAAAVHH